VFLLAGDPTYPNAAPNACSANSLAFDHLSFGLAGWAKAAQGGLRREGKHWVLHVTPEAGPVKTDEARDVVLHRQVIEMGFPGVESKPKQPGIANRQRPERVSA
jgi:hypothetical protein